ncbi:MAG: hypothetical protein AAFV01_14845 [Bacteroidota bacterium]
MLPAVVLIATATLAAPQPVADRQAQAEIGGIRFPSQRTTLRPKYALPSCAALFNVAKRVKIFTVPESAHDDQIAYFSQKYIEILKGSTGDYLFGTQDLISSASTLSEEYLLYLLEARGDPSKLQRRVERVTVEVEFCMRLRDDLGPTDLEQLLTKP